MSKNNSVVKFTPARKTAALIFPEQAKLLKVTNDKELVAVNKFVKGGMALMKEIRAGYDDIISSANATWKGAIAKRDHYLNPVAEGVKIAKGTMAPYMEEQARKVREAEEARRKAEIAAEEAEIAAAEERQREAREALQDGDQEKAEAILAEPEPEIIPEKVDIPETVQLEGTHARRTWDWKIADLDLIPRKYFVLDRVAINKEVREKKDRTKIPGILVFQKTGISSREG